MRGWKLKEFLTPKPSQMKTPYLDRAIQELKDHIERIEVSTYAGIPETRAMLAEYESIKEHLNQKNNENAN